MTRTAIVTDYPFTGADDSNVAALNSGNDWWELNGVDGQLRVFQTGYYNAFSTIADCVYKGTGAGTFIADQYAKARLTGGPFANSDKYGVILLCNGDGTHGKGLFSAYRCYYDDTSGSQGVTCEKIVNGTVTALGAKITGAFALNDYIECEATTSGGVVTLTVYKTGVSIGTRTDSTSILTTGKPGICGTKGADTLLPDNWEAGNITAGGGGSTTAQARRRRQRIAGTGPH